MVEMHEATHRCECSGIDRRRSIVVVRVSIANPSLLADATAIAKQQRQCPLHRRNCSHHPSVPLCLSPRSNDEGVTFAQLPSPDEFVSSKSVKIRGLFTGNPALKYKDPDAPPKLNEDGEIESDEEEEEEEEEPVDEDEVDEDGNPVVRKPPPRRLTELERLSFNVREIESETGLVPRGAYYITATGEILKNPAFEGLSLEDSRKLASYVLLRNAQHAATLAAVRKMGVANHHDFLDPVVQKNTKVKNTWSLQVSDSGLEVSLRSLLYPGFEYTLEAGSTNYTGGYFGLGEKNGDIFML
jgi:hypothetical protein